MGLLERDAIFIALADSSRRLLLERLRLTNGQTLTALCAGQNMTRQAVTKHLAVLEAANLVVSVKRGRNKIHYINPVPIHAVALRWLERFTTTPMEVLERAK